jgi:hypothetical protein
MAKVGRPLKFNSPAEILEKAQAYFNETLAKNLPITVTGLCMALGTTRDVLMDYEDERGEEFSNAVKDCKLVCENYAETKLYGNNATGPIFALKNFGWKDKQEIENSTPQLDEVRNDLNKLISDVKARPAKNTRKPKKSMSIPA